PGTALPGGGRVPGYPWTRRRRGSPPRRGRRPRARHPDARGAAGSGASRCRRASIQPVARSRRTLAPNPELEEVPLVERHEPLLDVPRQRRRVHATLATERADGRGRGGPETHNPLLLSIGEQEHPYGRVRARRGLHPREEVEAV